MLIANNFFPFSSLFRYVLLWFFNPIKFDLSSLNRLFKHAPLNFSMGEWKWQQPVGELNKLWTDLNGRPVVIVEYFYFATRCTNSHEKLWLCYCCLHLVERAAVVVHWHVLSGLDGLGGYVDSVCMTDFTQTADIAYFYYKCTPSIKLYAVLVE